jgi:hypothetical protein
MEVTYMRSSINKALFVLFTWTMSIYNPSFAHVKWFLSKPESELLRQPKPALFTQIGWANMIVLACAFLVILTIYRMNATYINWPRNKYLTDWTNKHIALINLLMAIGLGSSLIYAGMTRTLLVPNFIICSHCPQWLPGAEIWIGVCLMLGLWSRLNGLAILGLMYMAVSKHGIIECFDILPLAGLAIYFILAGRSKFSFDYFLNPNRSTLIKFNYLGHFIIRTTMGLGLIVLALSEKLIHPQLAMDLLQHRPALNPFLLMGVSNPMFILVTGMAELLLGMFIVLGWFPRIAVLILLCIFFMTTTIFGWEEFFGHAACYSSIFSIALYGAVQSDALSLIHPIEWAINKLYWVKSAITL